MFVFYNNRQSLIQLSNYQTEPLQ